MQAKPVSQSCSPQSSSVLTIIIDDMDRSKFAWPRWPFHKQPYELDSLIRPTVTFTGALAHGCGTFLYTPAPLTIFCKPCARQIEAISKAGPGPGTFPSYLIVVADNTVKSAKNQFVSKFLAFLVSKKLFKSCTSHSRRHRSAVRCGAGFLEKERQLAVPN